MSERSQQLATSSIGVALMVLAMFLVCGVPSCKTPDGYSSTATYYRCFQCGASYKCEWYQGGLFGPSPECRRCGGRIHRTSPRLSGWNESREADF